MKLGGFADEAANGLEGQIAVTRELGWSFIELRSIDGVNVVDLPDDRFDELCARLRIEGISVPCLGSTIANWGKSVDEPFEPVLRTAERAARRARLLGAPYVRIMSWAVIRDPSGRAAADQREGERFSRLREIVRRFSDEGVTALHENCVNYGGMSFEHGLTLLREVPELRMVYDTGNPEMTPDFRKTFPYPNQDSWECYRALRPWIDHVHIKDGIRDPLTGSETYTFPAEGAGQVERVLADLLATGYSGDFSIEPHMAVVFHDDRVTSSEDARRENYLEYGRRTETLLRRLGAPL